MADDLASATVPGRLIDCDLNSLGPTNTTLIKDWLTTCRCDHLECLHSTCSPKRLLHVGDNSRHPRLHDLADFPPSTAIQYAALSYVWGGSQRFQTLQCTLKERLTAIQVDKLPEV